MSNKTNKINIFAVEEIVTISDLFRAENKEVSAIMLKESSLKIKSNCLDIHSSDISNGYGEDSQTVVLSIDADDDTKYHKQWFELKEYGNIKRLDSWKLVSERIEYKS